MDINLQVPKNQRCFECVDIMDTIKKLPDEILGKILSYLPTKEAVATSVLSKRWEHIWTLTSDLDFSDDWSSKCKDENDRIIKMKSFQKYVDTVIFYHGGSNIRKCEMSFYFKYVASSVYSWILAMITSNVQELSLRLHNLKCYTGYQLPWRLYSCNTLVVLRIFGTIALDLPAYVCFPCLKLLQITFAISLDDASTERLFSSCPVLEELTIDKMLNCREILNISVPSLKRLYINTGYPTSVQTKINTPCLEYLEIIHCEEDAPTRYSVNFTSSLVRAELEGFDIFLLCGISQVEYLVLTANDVSLQNIIRDSALPIFKNLKTLKLRVGWRPATDWKVFPKVLDLSPNLQVLVFPEGLVSLTLDNDDFNHFNWKRSEYVPECLSMHLKTIEIFEFVGFPEELQLVEYLLESAKVLEKMIIHRFVLSKNPEMEKKVEEDMAMSELLNLSVCSTTCQVPNFKTNGTCEIIFTD